MRYQRPEVGKIKIEKLGDYECFAVIDVQTKAFVFSNKASNQLRFVQKPNKALFAIAVCILHKSQLRLNDVQ